MKCGRVGDAVDVCLKMKWNEGTKEWILLENSADLLELLDFESSATINFKTSIKMPMYVGKKHNFSSVWKVCWHAIIYYNLSMILITHE